MSDDDATLELSLPSDEATTRLGAALAQLLRPGDTVLLSGPIGAGKTHLARALIQAALGRLEDVPSPTFTLVQTYETPGHETPGHDRRVYERRGHEIWHADLYRLSHPDEVLELGLEAAFASEICLIEWPDRLGGLAPPDALLLRLEAAGEGRLARLSGGRPGLLAGLARLWRGASGPDDRAALSAQFLEHAGWGAAERRFLAGDASDRSYDRLVRGAETAVLMDAPPGKGDDPAAFVAIAAHLRRQGLSAPEVLAQDLDHGFLLLEDLGDGLFARLLPDPALEPELYAAATDVLVHLQRASAPPGLPDLSAADWAEAAGMAPDWYAFAATGERPDRSRLTQRLAEALARHADGPRVLILRDFHAENLLWLPGRTGLARVGLLDFQLGQMGQPGYDLVSLVQDARRDVPEVIERAMVARFVAATGAEAAAFAAAHAVLGAQRALRILGIFARLCLVAGKPGYVALIPRVWGQLQRNLRHPALAALEAECRALLPEPSAGVLERIAAQCGRMR